MVIHRPEFLRLPLKQPVERTKEKVHISSKVKLPTVHNGVALGVSIDGSPVLLHDEELNMHAFICGSTGTGKTNTLLVILESAIRRGKPVIVVDGKGDPGLIKDLEELSQRYDRRFQKFSYRDHTHYNPFRHGDATELKDKLVAIEEWSEPYYKRAAERYLQLVFRVLKLLDMQIDLIEVQKMLDSKRLMQAVKKLKIDKEEANDMKNYINGLDAGHKNAIEGLKDRLALITESDIGPLFKDDEDTIDLLEAVKDKRVVIMSLSGLSHSSFTPALGAMIVEDLKTVAASMGAVEKEDYIYVVLDEFNLFAGEQVVNMINKSRSAGFCCLIATQELADLATAGGQELVAQVIGNTNVKIVHRQDVPSSAEYMAEVVGTKKIYEKTLMTEESLLGKRPTLKGAVKEGEEFIVHPNILKNLGRGEAVVIKKIPETTVDKTSIRLAEL
ncbi:type IV secretory system conjugative DNA transfer family protein [Hazenella coriacea]|uniref:type IV secretory system conjugative DNA transfer family protein n=1 Tax=Hazenella coriacea TaxID=1179467 RepID=UPI0014053635|nr:helicase HerA-like domain-containing protein [Hazenella coriacea]